MSEIQMPAAGLVKVKRDGPRGWHWIAAQHYDPAVHVLHDAPAAPPPTVQDAPAPKRRGRLPKTPTQE